MILDTLHRIDQAVTLFLNSLSTPFSDELWQLVTTSEVWYPLYLLIVVFLFVRLGWKKALVVILSIALCIACCDQLANLVKYSVGRLRPSYSYEMVFGKVNVLEHRGSFFGFFSAHAANAFSLTVCTVLGFRHDRKHSYRAFQIWMLAWAALVAVSRIFVGKHYLGDVLVGTMVGIAVGYSLGKLASAVIRRWVRESPAPSS